nr:RNA-directed DNA polymerase, eukaryota [Tanacetum cinerariifolium]
IGRAGNVGYTSIWCNIIKEMDRMPRSGIESEQWDHLLDSLEGVMLNPSEDRGIDIPSILCPLCETGVESSKHLFFNCSVVRAIFQRVCIWWDVSYMALDSFDEWISWITNLRLPSKQKSILEGVCYGLWWFIWAFRNKKIFGVVPSSKARWRHETVTFHHSRRDGDMKLLPSTIADQSITTLLAKVCWQSPGCISRQVEDCQSAYGS